MTRQTGRDGHVEHLIKITIIQLSVPADRDHGSTHDAGGGLGVVGRDQPAHIGFMLIGADEEFQEAADRHVGERVETVENDAVAFEEFAAKVGFDRFLTRGQERADGVGDEVERQGRTFDAVAEGVQALEGFDRGVEDAEAALGVGRAGEIIGQRGDDFDLATRQELGEVFLRRDEQNRQVAAVDDVPTEVARG